MKQLEEYNFDWDVNKNHKNYIKHGIKFEDAALVFYDSNRIEDYDFRHSLTEDRYVTIGSIGRMVVVIYTVRNEKIRIISARMATKKETDIYYGHSTIYIN